MTNLNNTLFNTSNRLHETHQNFWKPRDLKVGDRVQIGGNRNHRTPKWNVNNFLQCVLLYIIDYIF